MIGKKTNTAKNPQKAESPQDPPAPTDPDVFTTPSDDIIRAINDAKTEIIATIKQAGPAGNPAPKPWYKNIAGWLLTIVVLAMLYSIYLLIMLEAGKRIVLPWGP